MNKKILSLIVIIQLLICISSMSAQTTGDYNPVLPQVVPQTPQAAAFARYGEYPVSYSTGVPEISIPIYTIETKDIKLPLSISYHAAGIKVEDIATPVGLGWTLNWGGSITRAIYGVADTKGYANNTIKSESHVQALMQQSSNDKKWRKRWASYLSDSEDSQSDRYVIILTIK